MKIHQRVLIFLTIVSITGCYYDSEEKLYPKLSSPCDDITVTFSGTVKTILQPCLACHANTNALRDGSGIKLQDFADVQKYVTNGKMMGAINHSSNYIPMPQGGGKLPDCEINQLQKWIENNMPNN